MRWPFRRITRTAPDPSRLFAMSKRRMRQSYFRRELATQRCGGYPSPPRSPLSTKCRHKSKRVCSRAHLASDSRLRRAASRRSAENGTCHYPAQSDSGRTTNEPSREGFRSTCCVSVEASLWTCPHPSQDEALSASLSSSRGRGPGYQ